jgi:SAM-dependent methyltransferase
VSSPPAVFDENYYRTVYRNYTRQNPPRKLRFYQDLLTRHLGKSESIRLLDVGCAFAAFLSSLPRGWDLYGIDVSEHAIESARSKVPGVKLASAKLETLPFQGPFDAVTSFDVIEHIPDLGKVAEIVSGLLKPGGIFLFVVPVYDGPLGWLVHLLDKDPTHVHKTKRDFWLSWAAQFFEVVEWQGTYRYLTPMGVYMHFASRLFRRWSPAIAVVVRRKTQGPAVGSSKG